MGVNECLLGLLELTLFLVNVPNLLTDVLAPVLS
jgi:hypothetical protein